MECTNIESAWHQPGQVQLIASRLQFAVIAGHDGTMEDGFCAHPHVPAQHPLHQGTHHPLRTHTITGVMRMKQSGRVIKACSYKQTAEWDKCLLNCSREQLPPLQPYKCLIPGTYSDHLHAGSKSPPTTNHHSETYRNTLVPAATACTMSFPWAGRM